jgi:hypothetical protein
VLRVIRTADVIDQIAGVRPSGKQGLIQYVMANQGHVDSVTANNLLNHILYGAEDGGDVDAELRALGLETVTSLYESISYGRFDSPAQRQSFKAPVPESLHVLNQSLGNLTQPYNQAIMGLIAAYNGAEGVEFAEALWAEEGRPGTYVEARALIDLGNAPLTDPQVAAFHQFEMTTFNAFAQANASAIGLKPEHIGDLTLELIEAEPRLCGQYCAGQNGQASVLKLNAKAATFQNNPAAAEGTRYHEAVHHFNKALTQAMQQGDIPPQHPLYYAARVLQANQVAYLGGDNALGHEAYATQAEELGPQALGNITETIASSRREAIQVATAIELNEAMPVGLRKEFTFGVIGGGKGIAVVPRSPQVAVAGAEGPAVRAA